MKGEAMEAAKMNSRNQRTLVPTSTLVPEIREEMYSRKPIDGSAPNESTLSSNSSSDWNFHLDVLNSLKTEPDDFGEADDIIKNRHLLPSSHVKPDPEVPIPTHQLQAYHGYSQPVWPSYQTPIISNDRYYNHSMPCYPAMYSHHHHHHHHLYHQMPSLIPPPTAYHHPLPTIPQSFDFITKGIKREQDESQQISPKKRGRKPKNHKKEEGDILDGNSDTKKCWPQCNDKPCGSPTTVEKTRKKIDRFNGIPEEEVAKKTLPDHLGPNLDIVIVGINPGLFAAYKGHHYAGPGNHFWKCLFMSGIIKEPYTADDDFRLLDLGIGFTNIVARTTRGGADLTRKEIKEGGDILLAKLRYYQPKIVVFNGKGIYEVFSGKKQFFLGRQPEKIEGTQTHIWVMPSSSARCAQLPRALDKVPFYVALKKFRDYLNGKLKILNEDELIFPDVKLRNFKKESDEKAEAAKTSLSCADPFSY